MTEARDAREVAREILSPRDPRLRQLYRRRPWRSTAALVRCWSFIALAVGLVAWRMTPVTLAVAFVVIGTQQYALSILSHEAKHRNLFDSATLNDRIGTWLAAAPIGASFTAERRRHLAHHDRLGHDDDPDRVLHRAGDKTSTGELLLYLTSLTTLAHSSAPRERWQAIPVQLLLFVAFVQLLGWWLYPLLWVAPLFLLMLVPARIRQFCEHAQPAVPDDTVDDRRLVSYRPNLVERIFLAPFQIGYHAEHHLWPGVPCWNLPELARLLPDDARRERIERRGSYTGFLIDYFRRLPLAAAPADR